MPTEVEARFAADGPLPLEALTRAARLGPAVLGRPRTADETDRYLDTDDGALATARWACRLRTRDGLTRISLKGPPEAGDRDDWHHRRPELEGPATEELDPSAWPPSSARDLLDRLRGGAPLRERLRLVQRRTERSVTLDGIPFGTLTCDQVRVEREGSAAGDLNVVELELHDDEGGADARAALETLAGALDSMPGLRPEPRTKLERALDLLGESRP